MNTPRIQTSRLTITIPQINRASCVAKYVSDNRSFHKPWDPPRSEDYYSKSYWQKILVQHYNEFMEDRSAKFFIFLTESDEVIGHCNFSCFIRGCFQCTNLGFSLAEKAQGHGYMHEALRGAIDYIFNQKHFHRIQANHLPHNFRSQKLLRRLGFITEGYARDYLFIDDRWQDHVLNSLTNSKVTLCCKP